MSQYKKLTQTKRAFRFHARTFVDRYRGRSLALHTLNETSLGCGCTGLLPEAEAPSASSTLFFILVSSYTD